VQVFLCPQVSEGVVMKLFTWPNRQITYVRRVNRRVGSFDHPDTGPVIQLEIFASDDSAKTTEVSELRMSRREAYMLANRLTKEGRRYDVS
jgi:hypothetical protein